jgi:hypothetical protein
MIQPVLIPCLEAQAVGGRSIPPFQHNLPCPITLTAQRGSGTPCPARDLRLTFHRGGAIGREPQSLSFANLMNLLDDHLQPEIDGLENEQVAEICAQFWDLCQQGPAQTKVWDAAQAACGLSSPTGKTPWGDYEIHLYNGFIFYLPAPSGVGKLRQDKDTLKIAWVHAKNPSSHTSLKAVKDLSLWLEWLSEVNDWPSFSTPVLGG